MRRTIMSRFYIDCRDYPGDIGNYLATYFGVPGFKYEIKTLLDVEEGLKMIGMG